MKRRMLKVAFAFSQRLIRTCFLLECPSKLLSMFLSFLSSFAFDFGPLTLGFLGLFDRSILSVGSTAGM